MTSEGKKIFLTEFEKNKSLKSSNLRDNLNVFFWYLKKFPIESIIFIFLLFVSSLIEGIGLLSIFPLLSIIFENSDNSDTTIIIYFKLLFNKFNVDFNILNISIFFILIMTLKAILRYFSLLIVGLKSSDITKDLRKELLGDILNLKWLYFTKYKSGEIVAVLTHAVEKSSSVGILISKFISLIFQLIIVFFAALFISAKITIIAITLGIIVFIIINIFIKKIREAGASQTSVMNLFTSRLIDSISTIKSIKSMSKEEKLMDFLSIQVNDLNYSNKKIVKNSVLIDTLPEPIIAILISFLLVSGSFFNLYNSPEVLITILVLILRMLMSLNALQNNLKSIAVSQASLWFLKLVSERFKDNLEELSGNENYLFKEDIRFNNLSFSYNNKNIFVDVNILIQKGKITSIIGPSGIGKTTLIDLIIGLLKPNKGSILVDGKDLNNISKTNWRKKIGYVPQETVLFNDTIESNITLGNSIDPTKIIKILKMVELGNLVKSNDDLNNIVGERGYQISGGQRQRVSIARALIDDPDILILDEATSSLDPEAESKICDTLLNLVKIKKNLTIISISHQQQIKNISDFIYEIENQNIHRIK